MRGVGIGMWGLRMNPEAKRMKQKTNKKTKKSDILLLLGLECCCGWHWGVRSADKT